MSTNRLASSDNAYFEIQPITVNISPFDPPAEVNAIGWDIPYIERGATSAGCGCYMLNTANPENVIYNWSVQIPGSVLNQWLDDSVIDDYICSTDPRFVKV